MSEPQYEPSGLDEFASNERTDHLPLIATPGWDREEGERTIADLQARLDAAQAEVRALLHIRSVLETEITALRGSGRTDSWSERAPEGWNQVEETVDEYWAAMAKADPDGPQQRCYAITESAGEVMGDLIGDAIEAAAPFTTHMDDCECSDCTTRNVMLSAARIARGGAS